MSTAIYHGNPGCYKTSSLVQDVIIPALYEGRVVIHNIRGLDDLSRIETVFEMPLPDTANMLVIEHDDQKGFDTIARFFHFAPFGALIVIDEAQRVYPKSERKLTDYNLPPDFVQDLPIDRPLSVPEAFDRHRHFNWDIYLSTTNIAKIHPEVRLVAEWAYRLANQTGLLPWYKHRYKVFRHDAEQSGKSVSHYDGTPVSRKMDTKVFDVYKSTATGIGKKSAIKRSVFADPKLRFLGFFLVILLVGFIYNASKVVERRLQPHQTPQPVSVVEVPKIVSNASVRAPDQLSTKGSSPAPVIQQPFQLNSIFHVGKLNGYDIFTVKNSSDDQLTLYDYELRQMGYIVVAYRLCFVKIQFGSDVHYSTCPEHVVPQSTQLVSNQTIPAVTSSPVVNTF